MLTQDRCRPSRTQVDLYNILNTNCDGNKGDANLNDDDICKAMKDKDLQDYKVGDDFAT